MKFIFTVFYNIWKLEQPNYFCVEYFPQKAMVIMAVNVSCTKSNN